MGEIIRRIRGTDFCNQIEEGTSGEADELVGGARVLRPGQERAAAGGRRRPRLRGRLGRARERTGGVGQKRPKGERGGGWACKVREADFSPREREGVRPRRLQPKRERKKAE